MRTTRCWAWTRWSPTPWSSSSDPTTPGTTLWSGTRSPYLQNLSWSSNPIVWIGQLVCQLKLNASCPYLMELSRIKICPNIYSWPLDQLTKTDKVSRQVCILLRMQDGSSYHSLSCPGYCMSGCLSASPLRWCCSTLMTRSQSSSPSGAPAGGMSWLSSPWV